MIRAVKRSMIYDIDFLDEGAYGEVFKARLAYCSRPEAKKVLVRVPRNYVVSKKAYSEAKAIYSALPHPNILEIIGVSRKDSTIPWIVTEYNPYPGNLHSYIRSYAGGIPNTGMMDIAHGIACGMAYLHDMEVVHGDLAARNCLVGPGWHVKIGDLGKYQQKHVDCYYKYGRELAPIRWMPPENLPSIRWNIGPKFTKKGDVWAYGVLLFEIWSRAKMPYGFMDDDDVIASVIYGANPRKYEPIYARGHITYLMESCWEKPKHYRPDFHSIKTNFYRYY